MARVLIVDDEERIRTSLKSALDRRGHDVVTAASLEDGQRFSSGGFDVVLLDVMLPDGSGLDLLRTILRRDPSQLVVMISGHADIDMAVDAIRGGAYDFLEKPLSLDRVLVTVDNAARTTNLRSENRRLNSLVYGEFIGESEPIRKLKEQIQKSAARTNRFLISGENGTGKELVANLIHKASACADGPFVAVNCAALPTDLVESELFGHTQGAFTGATKARKGYFVEASGGTIFLDEIGDMSSAAQAKILRVVENRVVTPVGTEKTIAVEGNIVAASNRDLGELVDAGKFRQDLLYRLNVVHLAIPALRERREDIPLLAAAFLSRFADETKTPVKTLSREAEQRLVDYDYPGNTRELKNLIERLTIYCDEQVIPESAVKDVLPRRTLDQPRPLKEAVAEYERAAIDQAIRYCGGSKTDAARLLGIERSHLYKKIRKLKK